MIENTCFEKMHFCRRISVHDLTETSELSRIRQNPKLPLPLRFLRRFLRPDLLQEAAPLTIVTIIPTNYSGSMDCRLFRNHR